MFLFLLGLSGCGSPSSDEPAGGQASSAAQGVAASTVRGMPAPEEARRTEPKVGSSSPAQPARTSSSQDPDSQTANNPAAQPSPDGRAQPEQADRQARESWYADAREHPDVSVRLHALEFWAQKPGDSIDILTQALVDGDEQVRARAQELWEQQLAGEAAAELPSQNGMPVQQ